MVTEDAYDLKNDLQDQGKVDTASSVIFSGSIEKITRYRGTLICVLSNHSPSPFAPTSSMTHSRKRGLWQTTGIIYKKRFFPARALPFPNLMQAAFFPLTANGKTANLKNGGPNRANARKLCHRMARGDRRAKQRFEAMAPERRAAGHFRHHSAGFLSEKTPFPAKNIPQNINIYIDNQTFV